MQAIDKKLKTNKQRNLIRMYPGGNAHIYTNLYVYVFGCMPSVEYTLYTHTYGVSRFSCSFATVNYV